MAEALAAIPGRLPAADNYRMPTTATDYCQVNLAFLRQPRLQAPLRGSARPDCKIETFQRL
jgi:hypothetical protein